MNAMNKSFSHVVRHRRSMREFLPEALPSELIQSVLEDAQQAPSNCNIQPWQVHVVSGKKRDELAAALMAADAASHFTPDYYFDMSEYPALYAGRAQSSAKARYDAINVSREDKEGRSRALRLNLDFFGAPHVAFLFMPALGDSVRVASDIGMYGQTFLLSLTAHGLAGIPQTMLGMYADTVREELGIEPELKMLFGISFGYADRAAAANDIVVGRIPLAESVTFHE
ncbi:nitroreductase [Pseudomonas chlororaphis]|uniref:Nitroreductase n=1 Tax=Pseudomonas chlororaphis TaxID=587753 RepID=A0AAQ0AQH4_9PSED|nr:nitroreductase [Pseudomonas chlororaphis]AIC22911.1 nitroreductase [Pseudomonas chlororaphis]AUG44068.1 nitroreductase [Pseudomonas chlororaphis]QNR47892.1 nitroreductase [Pseudomonas chlororaphis]